MTSKLKKWANEIFIDGLAGMAMGLFATLIIGTIIQQIGTLVGGTVGSFLFQIGKMASAVTGAGIGVGVAIKFKESTLVTISAATAGMIGAFASKLLAGTVVSGSVITLAGPSCRLSLKNKSTWKVICSGKKKRRLPYHRSLKQ